MVFFAGGDQCDYVKYFKGTLVETAVESVYATGRRVGGTSAGLAIQGDFSYDGCTGSALSTDALANPYHRTITFTYDFFHWANLQGTITDSHFVTRDRMGRTLAFLARQIQDGKAASALSVAVNEATSVVVDKNGLATVMGDGPAYFVLGDHAPEVCQPGVPLTYSNYKIWKVTTGGHLRPPEPAHDRLLPAQRQQRRDQLEPVLDGRPASAGGPAGALPRTRRWQLTLSRCIIHLKNIEPHRAREVQRFARDHPSHLERG